jgi:alkylation response protein AidB-like acyl-CoA dehydrogenase
MHYQLTKEQEALKKRARDFLEKEIVPIANQRDRLGILTKEEIKKYIAMLSPLGYVIGHVPKEWGGMGLSFLEQELLQEELARAWSSLCQTLDAHLAMVVQVAQVGTEDQKKRLVPKGMTGEYLFCDMMSEPDAGSDTRNIKTTAILEGDHYVVNGVKRWSTNGTLADVGILSALSDPDLFAKTHREGVVRLIVEKEVSPWVARDLPFIGNRAGNTGEIAFKNCRVPKENLYNPQGYVDEMATRGVARVMVAVMLLGGMQAALDASIDYCKKRIQFGRPIGGFQLVQEMIAEMIIDVEATRLLTYRACELIDNRVRCDLEQNMAKAFAAEAAVRVTDKAIQVHGALGLTTDEGYSLERYYRDARLGGIGEGTTQIVKLVMGRRAIGIPAYV